MSGSKRRLRERPDCTAGKNNRGKVGERDLTKLFFSRFLTSIFLKCPQMSPFLPKYSQTPPSLLEGIQWSSRARSLHQQAKAGAGWKRAHVWGVGFRLINGLFWQSGLFFGIWLEVGNRGILRAFPGAVVGKRGLIWGWIGGGEMIWYTECVFNLP